eukprot:6173075-Pleurochrysis_carterae.AAC.1
MRGVRHGYKPYAWGTTRAVFNNTKFPGRRQIDRAALRAAAAELRWHDDDIVDQVGEGGVEVRSEAELITVLSSHQQGLLGQAQAAAKAVAADLAQEWVAPPVRHLLYVPFRLQPRDVVLQQRQRVSTAVDGSLHVGEYDKPRVTTNASFGGIDSVNAGVPEAERVVRLPRVQELARALAIIGACARFAPTAAQALVAALYVVDDKSAYRFCPVQHANLWTQCFIWRDAEEWAAVVVDFTDAW